jgi:hypothetical protein
MPVKYFHAKETYWSMDAQTATWFKAQISVQAGAKKKVQIDWNGQL